MQNELDNLPPYFQTITEIRKNASKTSVVTLQEIKEMSLSVGITEEEWDDFIATSNKYQQKGNAFLKADNAEDALKEYTKAYELNPYDENTCMGLAKVYQKKWREDKYRSDAYKAIFYARQCLQLNPSSQQAANLISKTKKEIPSISMVIWSWCKPLIWPAILGGILFGGWWYRADLLNVWNSISQQIEEKLAEKESKTPETIELKNIRFDTGEFKIKEESIPELDNLVKFLKKNEQIKGEIGGHSDDTGDAQWNLTLSEQRAKAVYEYLIAQGISSNRLTYKGYGSDNPLHKNDSENNRAKNRRIEFKQTN